MLLRRQIIEIGCSRSILVILLVLNYVCHYEVVCTQIPSQIQKKEIFWMHIQKTSSWIGSFILAWACPEYCKIDLESQKIHPHRTFYKEDSPDRYNYLEHFENHFVPVNLSKANMVILSDKMLCSVTINSHSSAFGYHVPYDNPRMNHTVITMFRNPSIRIVSAYLFNVMIPLGLPIEAPLKSYDEVRASFVKAKNPFVEYINYPGMSSCQTKMLLGWVCGYKIEFTAKDMNEAIRRLQDLYFFGITEEPEASANLFLAMNYVDGGQHAKRLETLTSPPFMFTHTRENSRHSDEMEEKLLKILSNRKWKDKFDEELYYHAKVLFYERCRKYNIPTEFGEIDRSSFRISR